MKSKRAFIIGAVAGLVLVSAAGVAAIRTFTPDKAPTYLVETAKIGDVEKAVLATGALQPFEVVLVGTSVSGQLVELNVKLGDMVRAGQVIAQIDPQQLKNQLRDRESQLQSQRAMVANFTSNVQMAEANMNRQQTLKDKGVASQMQYDQATNQLRQSKSQLANFEGQVKTSEIQVETALNNLEKATIRAPIDGIVAEVVARQGQTLNANQSTPTILRIAKMDLMTVRTQVSEADIVKVKPGQKVYFTVLGEPDKRYYATLRTREVTPAGGVLDPNGTSGPKTAVYYNALFEVPNPNNELLPAMTAEVHVVLDEAKKVVTVPLTAVGSRAADGTSTVRVLGADGVPVDRKIVLGLTNHSVAEVKSGLKAGEKVILGEATKTAAAPAAKGPLFPGMTAPQQ